MLRTSVNTRADGSVEDKLSDAAFAPFVEALNAFRHPYSDISAPALAIYAVGEEWQRSEGTWRAACRERFAAETPQGEVLEMQASHYLFLDHRDEVLLAMREFLR